MSETPGKYGQLISNAKKASNPASQKASEPEVNLCVRVPKSQRQWWAAQAKMNGTTMTDVIKKALIAEFGLPPK